MPATLTAKNIMSWRCNGREREVGISPVTVPDEVADYRTGKRYAARINKRHVEKVREQIRNAKIHQRAECADSHELKKAGSLLRVGKNDSHFNPSLSLKYGMVLRSPSSRSTLGSQPRMVRARIISG